MFGGGKKKAEMEHAQDVGRQIGVAAGDDIKAYIAKVVPVAASGALRGFADLIADLHGDPRNDDLNRDKAAEIVTFNATVVEVLAPLQQQLTEQIAQKYDFALNAELRGLFAELIEKEFRDQRGRIVDAALYMAGLSGTWLTELLEDELARR